MTHRILFFCALIVAQILVANQDSWKGDEYAKNSASQQASADDFLQGMSLEEMETILDVGCGDGKITAALAQMIPGGTVLVSPIPNWICLRAPAK